MLTRLFWTLPIIGLLAAPTFAQNGDKPGVIQRPPPKHWVIPPAPVLTAEEELKTFKLAPGFHAELAAAEPLVGDPIAAVFGPDGRLWVVEMRSFMQDVDAKGEHDPISAVVVLDDTDGDGRFDKRTVFLDHLVMPRTVSLVGDGVLIAEPPHLWFARDTDGDGVADSKVEVAADYGGTGNPEHMANGLVWMMDNWLYSANHAVRYRYHGGDKFTAEPTITRGQWGITQDDIGRLYTNNNSELARYDAVPSAYLARNPNLATPHGVNVQVAPPKDLPTWPSRITPGINRGYNTLRPDGTLRAVTAACSPVIYRGALLPPEFRGDVFVCEPAGNLAKRVRLTERDGVVTGVNAYGQSEFLTSTDERFRPVSIYNGPDGALWLVDMYRGVIQHHTYVTSYLRAQIKDRKLEEGRGLGRIWRIVPDGAPAYVKPTLATATSAQLVEKLADAQGWVRDTAQRLLVERRDASVVPVLRTLATNPIATPLARLHALWTLDGLAAFDAQTSLVALTDADSRVCAAAVRLSEKFLGSDSDPLVITQLSSLVTSRQEPAVRLQLALSLGALQPVSSAEPLLAKLLAQAGTQPFIASAAISGLAGRELEFAEALITDPKNKSVAPALALATSAILKAGDATRITRVLSLANDEKSPAWIHSAVLDGIKGFLPRRADGASVIGSLPAEPTPLIALAQKTTTPDGKRAVALLKLLNWPGKTGQATAVVTLSADEKILFEKGRARYTELCANCHQPNGQGLVGLAPSLVNSRWTLGPESIAARIVLCGKEDDGKVMPTLKGALNDEAIAGTLTFIRNSWGNIAAPVSVAAVAKARAETEDRDEPFHEADLVELLKNP